MLKEKYSTAFSSLKLLSVITKHINISLIDQAQIHYVKSDVIIKDLVHKKPLNGITDNVIIVFI
jgi:hypothetical protein